VIEEKEKGKSRFGERNFRKVVKRILYLAG